MSGFFFEFGGLPGGEFVAEDVVIDALFGIGGTDFAVPEGAVGFGFEDLFAPAVEDDQLEDFEIHAFVIEEIVKSVAIGGEYVGDDLEVAGTGIDPHRIADLTTEEPGGD